MPMGITSDITRTSVFLCAILLLSWPQWRSKRGATLPATSPSLSPERTVRRVMDTWKRLSHKKKLKLQCKYDFPSRENNTAIEQLAVTTANVRVLGLVFFYSPALWYSPLLLVYRVTLQHPLGEPLFYPQGWTHFRTESLPQQSEGPYNFPALPFPKPKSSNLNWH